MFRTLTNGSLIQVIGDPHFGRKFINGVPLNRRGEREAGQMKLFRSLMNNLVEDGDSDVGVPDREVEAVIMMGDLFDQFKVDNNILLEVYEVIAEASWNHEDVEFFMIQGNHDVTRDNESVSSFEVLARMLNHRANVTFVTTPEYHTTKSGDTIVMFPYDAFDKSAEAARLAKFWNTSHISAAFGHWDIEDFGNDHNLIPIKELAPIVDYIFTGHVHTPTTWWVTKDGYHMDETIITETFDKITRIEVIGSMQPYSHGEDPMGKMYVTVDLETYQDAISKHPDWYHNHALRIILKKGEELPLNIDAMQIAYKFVDENEQDEVEAKMEVFSFKTLFDDCLKENNVTDEQIETVWDKYQEKSRDAQEA